ncbi:MAG: VWA domain-containing protein [Bdellovibrionales bacterium]|nr:VWA domain-containing protein [Bdellovibrionales bacterium]
MNSQKNRFIRLLQSQRFGVVAFTFLTAVTAVVLCLPGGTHGTPILPVHPPTPLPSVDRVVVSGSIGQPKVVQGSEGVVALQLSVQTPAGGSSESDARPTDFVVVLDRSGSMGAANKLPFAKEAIVALLERLRPVDRFGLITFDHFASAAIPFGEVTPASREAYATLVRSLQPGGATNISHGLEVARSMLASAASDRLQKVILLSDGEATAGDTSREGLLALTRSMVNTDISTSTIGLGLGFNETLLAELADHGQGAYGYLEHLGGLSDLLVRTLEQTRSVYAAKSTVTLQLGEGVRLVDAAGYPTEQVDGNAISLATGSLLSSGLKTMILTLAVPTAELGEQALGSVTVRYVRDGAEQQTTLDDALKVAVVSEAHRSEAVASMDSGVVKRTWLANNFGRMQKELQQWVREGNEASARQVLEKYLSDAEAAAPAGSAVGDELRVELAPQVAEMESKLEQAFSGNAARQREQQNRVAKELLSESRGNLGKATY